MHESEEQPPRKSHAPGVMTSCAHAAAADTYNFREIARIIRCGFSFSSSRLFMGGGRERVFSGDRAIEWKPRGV